jgi:hypothetical protein
MRSIILTVITPLVAVILLAGVFWHAPFVQTVSNTLLGWIITLAGAAGLIGIGSLLAAHTRKVAKGQKGWFYSLTALLSFSAIFTLGLVLRPADALYSALVAAILVPVEASLLALLAITLIAALIRMLRPGMGFHSVLFFFSAVIFLWAATGFIPFERTAKIQEVLTFFNTLPLGGARGLLLGIGLGSLLTGLRTLFRPSRGVE